jgi:hypothetical protein
MNVDTHNAIEVMSKGKVMTGGIGGAPALFMTPNPPLSAITNQITAVDKAQILVSTRAPGAAEARDVQLRLLVGLLEGETLYVQGIADACTTVLAAIEAIKAAGLDVAGASSYVKPLLAATQGQPGGPIALVANATALGGGRSYKVRCFNWEYTPDGGKTFVTLPPTPKARTAVANLTPLTVYGFRVALTSSSGVMGPWSPIVTLVVH